MIGKIYAARSIKILPDLILCSESFNKQIFLTQKIGLINNITKVGLIIVFEFDIYLFLYDIYLLVIYLHNNIFNYYNIYYYITIFEISE